MKKIYFLPLILSLTFQYITMAQTDVKLIYIADPMCSWCYGFAPELNKVLAAIDPSIELHLVMGGLRPYNDETMTQLGDFLKEHWEQVEERSGQPFNYNILSDTSFVYDTEPACRAVVVMRSLKPAATLDFFRAVQKVFYLENKNTGLVDTYLPIAASFGVAEVDFKAAFESAEIKKATRDDFEMSNSLDVQGFPTLVLKHGEDYYEVAYGYSESEKIISRIGKVLEKKVGSK